MVSSFQRGSGRRRTMLCFAIMCQQSGISIILLHISLFTQIFFSLSNRVKMLPPQKLLQSCQTLNRILQV